MRSVATIMDNLASLYKMNPLSQMTIRMRIILFSILVTFIPAAGLGWLFYQNNQEMLAENNVMTNPVDKKTISWKTLAGISLSTLALLAAVQIIISNSMKMLPVV